MLGVLQGFVTIGVLVAVGWWLAHRRVLDDAAQVALSRLAFHAASPALLLTVLQRTPLDQVLSGNLLTALLSFVVVALLYQVVLLRIDPGIDFGERLAGTLSAAYVNAGNLGLPIALYVLGNIAWVAPTLLFQLLMATPLFMALLDRAVTGPVSPWRFVGKVFSNPITLGALAGVLLTVFDVTLPTFLSAPIELLGSMAVPAMLVAFGIALRGGPRPGAGGSAQHVWTIVALKLLVMPVVAFGIGTALGMHGQELLAVVVIAALPTAQNVFTYSVTYNRGVPLARDAVFISTFASLPVILAIAAAFHALGVV